MTSHRAADAPAHPTGGQGSLRSLGRSLPGILLASAMATGWLITNMTYSAAEFPPAASPVPEGGWSSEGDIATDVPSDTEPPAPAWRPRHHREHPGCVPSSAHVIADQVLVVRSDSSVDRMDFDEAWSRTHNAEPADDIWVIGTCPG
ncbi:hypothetical protein [Nocardioides sp. Leaf285]|uniref:hypothetical protein n=1 Tax=Nocardioides sp. Leaf285 TaxID=1736322 RepID=UPI0007028023|nr:hypothetical protein [Nocardioides sp. Leaf285]KQP63095.1 hypothetical protein ASF47_18970 [Nocardioides sp. Leaf285]